MNNPLGTATDDIDITVRLEGAASMALAALSVATGKPQEQLVVEALIAASARWKQPPFRSSTSRAGREGRYSGHAWGQHVRWRATRKRVRSTKARAVLRSRYARYGIILPARPIVRDAW